MGGAGPSGLQGAAGYPGDDIVPQYSSSSDEEEQTGMEGATNTWAAVEGEEGSEDDDDSEQLSVQVSYDWYK